MDATEINAKLEKKLKADLNDIPNLRVEQEGTGRVLATLQMGQFRISLRQKSRNSTNVSGLIIHHEDDTQLKRALDFIQDKQPSRKKGHTLVQLSDYDEAVALIRHMAVGTPRGRTTAGGRRPRFDFKEMGVAVPGTLSYVRNPAHTVTTTDNNQVLYEGQKYTLTHVTRHFMNEQGGCTEHWVYEGRNLGDIYDDTYGPRDGEPSPAKKPSSKEANLKWLEHLRADVADGYTLGGPYENGDIRCTLATGGLSMVVRYRVTEENFTVSFHSTSNDALLAQAGKQLAPFATETGGGDSYVRYSGLSYKYVVEMLHSIANNAHAMEVEDTAIENELTSYVKPDQPRPRDRDAIVKVRVQHGTWAKGVKARGRCQLLPELTRNLIASHIKPWSRCDESTDEHRDRANGLCLSPCIDKLFEDGLIQFEDDGKIILHSELSAAERAIYGLNDDMRIKVIPGQDKYLRWHRDNVLVKS
ncbi:HNH endonuclease [Parahaliea mediterranea]|uniref:HNH endonuclease n=1 Tax=Parahaliea mediterranea TaxID=651086 RepID=UPI000E2E5396|nr:HNH endonuclease [Parahaliea mediterranea]